jgi:dTDP-4-amino-4,6-dideoxygalactose transaminase
MRIPAADLRAQHEPLRQELIEAFTRVLDSSAFINGADVESFEQEFAAYCGTTRAIGVANGTDALALALRAAGVGPGDTVALPAFTFAATIEAVEHAGARPLLVDIEPDTCLIEVNALERALREHSVRAILPVHLYGHPAAMNEINSLAGEHGAIVVEDAAQAHGARYHGRRAGALGDLACFSFYPTKNLGALGDAGAVTTSDDSFAEHLRMLRDHGQSAKYVHARVGFNSRLDTLQAAALRIKLRHLDSWNERRRAHAVRYRESLSDLRTLRLLQPRPQCEPVYHLFVVRCAERDGLRAALESAGIGTSIHYPIPLHLQPAFAHLGHAAGDFPAAEAAGREVLALPLYPELSEAQIDEVCTVVRAWVEQRR